MLLGYDRPSDVDTAVTFQDLGLDSLSAVQLRDDLAEATGLPLPIGLTFEYVTPAELVRHLCTQLTQPPPPPPPTRRSPCLSPPDHGDLEHWLSTATLDQVVDLIDDDLCRNHEDDQVMDDDEQR